MTLKDMLAKVVKLTFVLGIVFIVFGILSCFTGLGAILGIPLGIIGVFLIKGKQYLLNIVNEEDSITKNLYFYFENLKKILILCFVVIIAILIIIGIGYVYFNNMFMNLIF